MYVDIEEIHLNGNGTLHGGVYTSLIDNAMGLSVSSLVGLRTATMQMIRALLGGGQGGAHHVPERGRAQDAADGDRRGSGLRRGGELSRDGDGGVQDLREKR